MTMLKMVRILLYYIYVGLGRYRTWYNTTCMYESHDIWHYHSYYDSHIYHTDSQ